MNSNNETSNTTDEQQVDLIALSMEVIKRNSCNQEGNLRATQQGNETDPSNNFKSCQVSSPYKGNHATDELRELIRQVSQNYGGDDERFLTEYIDAVLANNDLEKALECFRDLVKQAPPVNNRQTTGASS